MLRLPCVSLTDPWASLVVNGDKTLETRKGPVLSGFSGPLVIHRTLAPCADYDLSRWGLSVPTRPAGWPADDRGMALGIVFVERTWRLPVDGTIVDLVHRLDNIDDLRRRACFDDIDGRYLSQVKWAAWFPAPVKATGKQGRWQIEIPRSHLPAWAIPGERDPGRSEPFVTLLPATEENCRLLTDCFTSQAKLALPALYLRAGKYTPKLAKDRGAYLGLCDARGYRVEDNTTATHIGITAGDDEHMEPLPSPPPPDQSPVGNPPTSPSAVAGGSSSLGDT